jgi:hypothetical protein
MSYKNQCGNRNLALNQEAGDWNRLEFAENVKAKSQRNGNKNKKEVKTEGSHLPGWGGVGCCLATSQAAMQSCPARQVCGLTR